MTKPKSHLDECAGDRMGDFISQAKKLLHSKTTMSTVVARLEQATNHTPREVEMLFRHAKCKQAGKGCMNELSRANKEVKRDD